MDAGVLRGEGLGGDRRGDVEDKVIRPVVLADAVGARRALRYSALTGAIYGDGWWPSAHWAAAVADLRASLAAGNLERVIYPPRRERPGPNPGDKEYWAALTDAPESLNHAQAWWMNGSRYGTGCTIADGPPRLRPARPTSASSSSGRATLSPLLHDDRDPRRGKAGGHRCRSAPQPFRQLGSRFFARTPGGGWGSPRNGNPDVTRSSSIIIGQPSHQDRGLFTRLGWPLPGCSPDRRPAFPAR